MTITKRAYYSATIGGFLNSTRNEIIGELTHQSESQSLLLTQTSAWESQIEILRAVLVPFQAEGHLYFEYVIPRMGRRIDVVLVLRHVLFLFEFKVGESEFTSSARDQVWDYALDLKNFHETSHNKTIVPVLVATNAHSMLAEAVQESNVDGVLPPICTSTVGLPLVIQQVMAMVDGDDIDASAWESGRYQPTPTIIEAASALYSGHGVTEISRNDAAAINLSKTSKVISEIIEDARSYSRKAICFVTGVPGAGKTLVGLNIATQHIDRESELYSVFLSGNGPLVDILREALARDKVSREKELGRTYRKGDARSEVKAFIQNVHHFRDDCIRDDLRPPIEHVALFDEAQRAWNLDQTASFMKRKKGLADFRLSEPEFLISCMDRHEDWAVIVCLVGGGQEINTGEAGIQEWIDSVRRSYEGWHIYLSAQLHDSEYGAGQVLKTLQGHSLLHTNPDLHLSVSMRSFRAENVSGFIKALLDIDSDHAKQLHHSISDRYPIVLTRSVEQAKQWLKSKARGSERYGIVVSSQAQRLKPHAIDVRSPMDPVHWFLDPKTDVRSSYYLEDVATEFHVQGLELDWTGVVWDADFRHTAKGWQHHSFCGDKWQNINSAQRKMYLKNAYRVILTRARQGMVIVVPSGEAEDSTRLPSFYDSTFEYLRGLGLPVLPA